ncbi:MAG: hypothetical protein OXU20_06860 [Myxococcales bacterium]|nr:hypothetical protein [Myxococcales bacterium]
MRHDSDAPTYPQRRPQSVGSASPRRPTMELVWKAMADSATVFGVHVPPASDGILVHGGLDITRLTLRGDTVWSVSGADIFTGEFSVTGQWVRAHDFEDREYLFDVRTGRAASG